MKLFKLTKEIGDSWFHETHNAILTATNLTDLYGLQKSIEQELNSFFVSTKDKVYLTMLLAYCSLRIKLMTKATQKGITLY